MTFQNTNCGLDRGYHWAFLLIFITGFLVISTHQGEASEEAELLHFSVQEANIYNEFYRKGPVAAHAVLTSGTAPRLIMAFPAGNSAVSLWFEKTDKPVSWQKLSNISPVKKQLNGHRLYGIEADMRVEASQLKVSSAILGNIRVVRTYMHTATVDKLLINDRKLEGGKVSWQRERLDGSGAYELTIEMRNGSSVEQDGDSILFTAGAGGTIDFQVGAFTGDSPLTPIPMAELLTTDAANDQLSRNILAFLSYEEKLLAGSWRFNTYFGRDTLLSAALLMPVLKPRVIEAALGSVLERVSSTGQIAHEEDIAEFAILRRLKATGSPVHKPIYDYAMIDENFMLAIVAAKYWLGAGSDSKNVHAFLAKMANNGMLYSDLLIKNIELILSETKAFYDNPIAGNLIEIEKGSRVGDWRDSQEGLANGRYPYSVNVALAPAALRAIADLRATGLLKPYDQQIEGLEIVDKVASVWETQAHGFFVASINNDDAKDQILTYARKQKVPAGTALQAVGGQDVTLVSLALDHAGRAIPVIQSDPGFLLFFSDPDEARLSLSLDKIMQPFPAGLMTSAGLLVANPVHAPEVADIFTKGHYHGTVVWPWQQAMLAEGLKRQLARRDVSHSLKQKLAKYQTSLWNAIQTGHSVKTAELWSWNFEGSRYQAAAYGQDIEHLTESNAAQLWSTVYLAVQPPR